MRIGMARFARELPKRRKLPATPGRPLPSASSRAALCISISPPAFPRATRRWHRALVGLFRSPGKPRNGRNRHYQHTHATTETKPEQSTTQVNFFHFWLEINPDSTLRPVVPQCEEKGTHPKPKKVKPKSTFCYKHLNLYTQIATLQTGKAHQSGRKTT